MLCSILEESIQAGALLHQNYFKCARARIRTRTPGRARYSSYIIFVYTVESAERVAREDSLLEFPVPSSHGSKD